MTAGNRGRCNAANTGAPEVRYSFGYWGNRVFSYTKTLDDETIEEGGYDYDEDWNIWLITRTVYAGAEEWRRQTVLKYDEMGRLWRVLEYERLLPDGDSECVAAREFRHASGRQRYLVRQLDPATCLTALASSSNWPTANSTSAPTPRARPEGSSWRT